MFDKPALRARIRAERDRFFAAHPPAIEPPPALLSRFQHGVTVASYVPVGSEADPSPVARAAVERGCAIVLPHVTVRSKPMRFLAWDSEEDLIPGPFGLHQPHHESAALVPDIVLTPLLAFDSHLNRLGQGAGYYDRAFAQFPEALRIGIAWSVQQVESLSAEAWDVPLHAVLTERDWIMPQ
ncbi:MAG: 5-formyltetrahydrofolate cyclo-ligase [Sphingomonas bacterium]|uniref:5-formyltetrahydrofolate cyclo-ligase n=1 Tax=Sphingomonas bacterium TaxID=1895847 RepID=UPI0026057C68|nr:5-formyltetrahydrofolate cyclo-ligase [Sphingomonas bacterium]MDB5704987.1 5-formyltetrahydrofolate cyclo-ligase [Sphingomonas bacterium]